MIDGLRPVIDDLRYSLRHPLVRLGIIAGIIAIGLVLVVGAALWWPARSEVHTLRDEIDVTRRQAVERLYGAQLAQEYERTEQQIVALETKLNTQTVQVSLLNHLSQLAKKHRVRILSESYEEGKIQSGYAPLYHEITLQGTYPRVRRFLLDIRSLPTLSLVQEAALNRGDGRGRSIKAQLRIVTYRKAGEIAAQSG